MTGQLAVCAGSAGPGNLHLINGLYDAQRSRVPVLAIAAHIPSGEIGSGYFQETAPAELFRECSVWSDVVTSAEQMPRALRGAMQAAGSQRRGAGPGTWRCRARPRTASVGPSSPARGSSQEQRTWTGPPSCSTIAPR